jgi:hypothetical protein
MNLETNENIPNQRPNRKWPTLAGRLSQPLASRAEALEQMKANGDVLSPMAERYLEKHKHDKKKH